MDGVRLQMVDKTIDPVETNQRPFEPGLSDGLSNRLRAG
jgi:hypothetical protein